MEYGPEPQGTWYCVAGSSHRSYAIERLDRQSNQFQLAIYNSPQIDQQQLIEVVQVKVIQNNAEGILGRGTTQNGKIIKIYAFQRTIDFVVEDSTAEVATGVCSYLSDWE